MNDIDTRLRSTFDRVASTTHAENRFNQLGVPAKRPVGMWTGLRVALAAFILLALAIGVPALVRAPTDSQNFGAESPEGIDPVATSPLTPVITLPVMSDVSDSPPPTVADDHPTDWYRLAPDLDVAWYRDTTSDDNPSMVCLRTPVAEQCAIDMMAPGVIETIPTAGDQMLVVTLGDTSTATLKVTLSDGTTTDAPIAWSDEIGWGVARFALDMGIDVTGMQTD